MKKAFISYKFTGETKENLENLLHPIVEALKNSSIDAYCNFFDENLPVRSKNFKPHEFVTDAFKNINESDFVFVVLNSEEKSEGMIMEIGYATAKNIPIVIAVKNNVTNTYLPGMANMVIPWDNINDLVEKISKIDFKNL
jgi:nucleoside 2-deoxyribosyltransferase